jgi:tetratricopeptide (TPR) repeat protein
LGPVLWLLGYPDQALAHGLKGLALARELTQPYSVIYAANLVIRTRLFRGEREDMHALVDELIPLCREQGFVSYLALSRVVQGWLLTEQGRQREGIEQMRRELLAWRATGAESARPYYLALLAETHGKAGAPHEGFSVLSECWPWMEKTQARVFEAELYRIQGELALQTSQVSGSKFTGEDIQKANVETDPPSLAPDAHSEAEAYFLKALAIAGQQQAKSLELRAVMSLARLWQRQGKIINARERLEEIYNWFTEGFDTKDLQDAAALLDALGGRVKRQERKREAKGNQRTEDQEPQDWKSKRQGDESPVLQSPRAPIAQSFSHPQLPSLEAQGSAPGTQDLALFRREGNHWTLSFAGATCRLKEARGLHYLAHLLRHPHREFHVMSLVNESPHTDGHSRDAQTAQNSSASPTHHEGFNNARDTFDPQMRGADKQRLAELRAELDEAYTLNDQGRIERAQSEIDDLTQELSQAMGLDGQVRQTRSVAEQARVNVTRTIKAAIRKIREYHPTLGQHLATTIKTGTYCAYTPDPRLPITWQR